MSIQPKELIKPLYTKNIVQSLAINPTSKHYKHNAKEGVITTLIDLLENSEKYKAKEQFTQSALKKLPSQNEVTLIGGSMEEIPFAYKDIDRIMLMQESLAEIHGRSMSRIVRMNKE